MVAESDAGTYTVVASGKPYITKAATADSSQAGQEFVPSPSDPDQGAFLNLHSETVALLTQIGTAVHIAYEGDNYENTYLFANPGAETRLDLVFNIVKAQPNPIKYGI